MYYGYEYGSAGERIKAVEAVRESKDDGAARVICTEYEYDKLLRLTGEVIKVNDSVTFDGLDFTDITDTNGTDSYILPEILDISSITWKGNIENRYTYDAVCNRTSKTTAVTGNVCGLDENVRTGTTIYTYNSLNQLTSTAYESDKDGGEVTTAYTYDLNGNLVSEHGGSEDRNYTYNAKNQLITATVSKGNGVTIESYSYDYEGNKVTKQVNEDGKVYYLNNTYGELTQAALELSKNTDGSYSVNKFYTRGLELISADIKDEDSTQNQAAYTRKIYIQDGHGSVTALAENEEDANAGESISNEDTGSRTANHITDTYVYDA